MASEQQPEEDRKPRCANDGELPQSRRAGHLHDQRPDMPEKSHPLRGRGVAASSVAMLEGKRHVAHAHARGADQELQQDLETDRSELDALDRGSLAEEIAGQGVRGLTGFAEESLNEPSTDS